MNSISNPYAKPSTPSTSLNNPPALSRQQWMVVTAAILVTIALRVFDIPMVNLGSMIAMTLLIGVASRNPVWALLPLGVRLLTDVIIEMKTGFGFFPSWPFDYGAYILIFALGYISTPTKYASTVVGSLTAVGLYFVISNTGVWWASGMYPHTADGLMTCLTNGLPFARGTIWGNLLLAPVFFALWNGATARAAVGGLKTEPAAETV